MKEKDHFFHLHYDSLKWSFSQYSNEKHYKDVQKIVLAVALAVFNMDYNVISDSSLTKEFREKLINLAKQKDYEIIEINLEADYEILLDRFRERVASALKNPERRISNLSEDRFKELFDIFTSEKNPSAISFRTDTQTIDQVSESVMNLF